MADTGIDGRHRSIGNAASYSGGEPRR